MCLLLFDTTLQDPVCSISSNTKNLWCLNQYILTIHQMIPKQILQWSPLQIFILCIIMIRSKHVWFFIILLTTWQASHLSISNWNPCPPRLLITRWFYSVLLGCIFRRDSVYSGTFLSYPADIRYHTPPENGKLTKSNTKWLCLYQRYIWYTYICST